MGLLCVPLGLEAVKADLIIFYFPEIDIFMCFRQIKWSGWWSSVELL